MKRAPRSTGALGSVAHHEAAHAVIGEVLGLPVQALTIKITRRRDYVSSGYVHCLRRRFFLRQRDEMHYHRRCAVMAMAGAEAETTLLFQPLPTPEAYAVDIDIAYAACANALRRRYQHADDDFPPCYRSLCQAADRDAPAAAASSPNHPPCGWRAADSPQIGPHRLPACLSYGKKSKASRLWWSVRRLRAQRADNASHTMNPEPHPLALLLHGALCVRRALPIHPRQRSARGAKSARRCSSTLKEITNADT